jgi:hypothetical protein
MRDEHIQLAEGPRVEQELQPLSGGTLAPFVLLRYPARPTGRQRLKAPAMELRNPFFVGHFPAPETEKMRTFSTSLVLKKQWKKAA